MNDLAGAPVSFWFFDIRRENSLFKRKLCGNTEKWQYASYRKNEQWWCININYLAADILLVNSTWCQLNFEKVTQTIQQSDTLRVFWKKTTFSADNLELNKGKTPFQSWLSDVEDIVFPTLAFQKLASNIKLGNFNRPTIRTIP